VIGILSKVRVPNHKSAFNANNLSIYLTLIQGIHLVKRRISQITSRKCFTWHLFTPSYWWIFVSQSPPCMCRRAKKWWSIHLHYVLSDIKFSSDSTEWRLHSLLKLLFLCGRKRTLSLLSLLSLRAGSRCSTIESGVARRIALLFADRADRACDSKVSLLAQLASTKLACSLFATVKWL